MNQSQRAYLIQQVEKTSEAQINGLESEIPERPSLNNYLIAACHDNTLEVLETKSLRAAMRERILKSEDGIVEEEETGDWDRKNRKYKKSEWKQEVKLNVTDIFILPKPYFDEMRKYEDKKKEVEKKIEAIQAQRDTIILKIQIGSASKLENLVLQIDNIMGDLDLINTQLLIGAKDEIKKLSEKNK